MAVAGLASLGYDDTTNQTVTVNGANAVVNFTVLSSSRATPVITWSSPAPITYGTALTAVELDAAANVPGTFAYAPPNGAVLNAGVNALTAVFTPTNVEQYNDTTASITLAVLPAPLTVTASNATRAYGQNNPVFGGTVVGLVNGDPIIATFVCTNTSPFQPRPALSLSQPC